MKTFLLDEVALTDSVFAERQGLVKAYLLNFDTDRLMHTFRLNAGITSGAEPLGGWESPECLLRGHFVGHFLSACAKMAYGLKEEKLREKANEIVDILGECACENGYLSAFEENQLDILEEREDSGVWAPYYTLHKILSGLVNCGIYLKNQKAIVLAENLALYISDRFEKLSYWKVDNILRCTKVNPANEFGGIGDVLYSLWEICQNSKILELAKLFDREYFIGNLAKGKDILGDLHANTHLPMVVAAMHRYSITGEAEYKRAALNFYDFVLGRTFSNGNSSSKAEHPAKGGVSERAEHWGNVVLTSEYITGEESESCCAHNTENLLAYLLEFGEDTIKYLNHLESLKYNAVVNSASGLTGLSQYHQPLGKNCIKKFSTFYNDFWCCTGSGIEAMAELQKNIWFRDNERIVLNMFVASVLHVKEDDLSIEMITDYPHSDKATLVIRSKKKVTLSIAWKENSIGAIEAENKDIQISRNNGFLIIKGVFSDNDRVLITINSAVEKVPLGKEKDVSCMMYGNILLAKIRGRYAKDQTSEKQCRYMFTTKDSVFVPLYTVEDERYTVYLTE